MRDGIEIELNKIITKAIKYCERLYDIYDDNGEITDLDIAYLVEILKGRE